MEFKIYLDYKEFENDINLHPNTKYGLNYLIEQYQGYLEGYKRIHIIYEDLYEASSGKRLNSQDVNFIELKDLLNDCEITNDDFQNFINKEEQHISFKGFSALFFNSKTYKYFSEFLNYNFEDCKWWIDLKFEKHIYLTEKIISELKDIYIGKVDSSQIESKKNKDLLKIYKNIHGFKFNYLTDYDKIKNEQTFLNYLTDRVEAYKEVSRIESDKELANCNAKVIRQLKPEEAADYYLGIKAKHNKIVEFIEGLIEIEKANVLLYNRSNVGINLPNNNIPEQDFSNNADKEKLIILEKLGVIDYIKSIQTKPETIQHTAEILSAIIGIKSTTLYTYLRPILNANRDDTDNNSPYKNPENLLNANKIIQKLKIKNGNL
ncbi:hypothetical protein [Chryseobacterium tongliaoense]|uniref:hypothetical protein n=1 Tax=Chryseobacterium tongliaoense TaxID=3240933 RepID=UPI0035158460